MASGQRDQSTTVVDEVLSMGDASTRDGNDRRKALLCEIQLLNQFGASSWRDRNIDRRTLPPLLRAAKVGDGSVTKMLLMGDVDVNETDPKGNTALHWCLSGSSSTHEPRIVWLLLKNGAKVFQGNKLGLTPVHSAATKGNYKALQSLLLHAKDCVNIPSKTKETPLFLVVKNGSVNCVKLLLQFGANPKVQNLRKQRPIDVATSQDVRFILNTANVVPPLMPSHSGGEGVSSRSAKNVVSNTVPGSQVLNRHNGSAGNATSMTGKEQIVPQPNVQGRNEQARPSRSTSTNTEHGVAARLAWSTGRTVELVSLGNGGVDPAAPHAGRGGQRALTRGGGVNPAAPQASRRGQGPLNRGGVNPAAPQAARGRGASTRGR